MSYVDYGDDRARERTLECEEKCNKEEDSAYESDGNVEKCLSSNACLILASLYLFTGTRR